MNKRNNFARSNFFVIFLGVFFVLLLVVFVNQTTQFKDYVVFFYIDTIGIEVMAVGKLQRTVYYF